MTDEKKRSNHALVSPPADGWEWMCQDRDEWKRRALTAEEQLRATQMRVLDLESELRALLTIK